MRYFLIIYLFSISCVNSQKDTAKQEKVGGPCQGCEAIYEYGERKLSAIDTLPGFNKAPQKLLVTGTVFQKDGRTPAPNVIIYAYHTDAEGIYPKKSDSKGFEQRHGYIRGWVKTDKKGNYTFYTFRPASYPNTTIEQHIHLTIKEPSKNEYYIDDITFADDPNLSKRTKNRKKPRGGKGVVALQRTDKYLLAKRDIILGMNIPNYP